MRRFILLSAMLLFSVTLLSFVLGCVTYRKNLISITRSKTTIALIDMAGSIRYGLNFADGVEEYSGLAVKLQEGVDMIQSLDNLFILDNQNRLIYRTNMKALSREMREIQAGEARLMDQAFYAAIPLTEEYRLLSQTSGTKVLEKLEEHDRNLVLLALCGFLASEIFIVVLRALHVKDRPRRILSYLVISIWVLGFSTNTGVATIKDYAENLEKIDQLIESSFELDLLTVEERGVSEEVISGMDDYLRRYSDNIPEIESVTYEDHTLVIRPNQEYLDHVYLDYVLDAVLSLVLTVLVMTEYRIFLESIKKRRPGEEPA